MAGSMEDILMMGSDSDSDDDGKVGVAEVAAPPAPPPAATNSSKSELTNRLKNLYSSSSSPPKSTGTIPNPIAAAPPRNIPPTMNVARTGAPSSSHNPNYVPPMVHNQHPHSNVPSSSSSQQQMQQTQQQPPPLVGVGRVPAPLPKARANNRAAPPPNRIAAVPNPTIPPSPMTASSVQQRQSYSTSSQSSRPRQYQAPPGRSNSSQGGVPHGISQHSNPHMSASEHSATSSRSSGQASMSVSDQEKKEKEKFLMFTRVLMKYLEQRDTAMHARAKAEIKDCYERNKNGDPAYKSLTQSMKARLKVTVGDEYWRKAHSYLEHFFKQKQKERARAGEQPHMSSQPSQQPHPQQPPSQQPHPHQPSQQPAPSIVRTSGQHQPPPHQPPVQHQPPPAQPMIPPPQQQQKIPIQQPPALTKQQVDAQKKKEKEKEEAAKKRREQRNANAKAKRAAKKAKETAAAALQAKGMQPAGTTSYPSGIPTPALTSSVAVPGPAVTSATASVSSAGSKKETKKKPKKVPSRPSVTKKKKTEPSYKFKDNVDHAFLIDTKSIPNILSKDHKLDLNLDEEQRILLYGDQRQREKVRAVTDAAADALSAGTVADGVLSEAGIPQLPWKLPAVYEAWGERNILSVRAAWAKVRLPESELLHDEKMKQEKKSIERVADVPTSAENVMSAPNILSKPVEERAPTRLEDDTTNHVWHNETRAAQDPTLALLSEATEMYLKEAIEKAVGKARLRQNLDGVRLWHTLHSHHADPSSTNGKQPPALIRLGCDVRRQVALADGNAVKIYQRMEEAIGRDNDTVHFEAEDPEKMVLEATSMADLSRKPPLKSAVSDADTEAKRRFEVFAGKDIQEPPFGRVPKKAKVLLSDLPVGTVSNQTSAIRARRRRLLGGW